MTNFHLFPGQDIWELRKDNGESLGSFPSRQKALERSRQIVSVQTGMLMVHHTDGTVENQFAYPPRRVDPAIYLG